MIDYQKILEELDIQYWTSGKNNVSGCYTIKCPCCDDHSRHGNLDPETGKYSCWRCNGAHPLRVLTLASGKPYTFVEKVFKNYSKGEVKVDRKKEYASELKIPGGLHPLPIQTNYLEKRGLDPATLEFNYGIRYGRMGERCNNIDVSFRIIIPIMDEYGTPISWQARDVTGKSEFRYVFPRSSDTLDDAKKHLYGAHLCRKRRRIAVVEGVFDAWKLGTGAVCTFGTSVTDDQIRLLANWEEIVLCFDYEPEAQQHARDIATKLSPLGNDIYIADTNLGLNPDGTARDLGDATSEEIEQFRETIGLKEKIWKIKLTTSSENLRTFAERLNL